MQIYESTFVIEGKVPETEIDKYVEKFTAVIKGSGGEVLLTDKLGKRTLAYQVGKSKDGFYVYMEIKLGTDMVKELERNYKNTENVIRFLTVAKVEHKPAKKKRKPKVVAAPAAHVSRSAPAASAPSAAPSVPAAPAAPAAPAVQPKEEPKA
ncbi:MAG: 30S ribosomal protein S6 [Candidatus Firestonebacteria bacterium]